MQLEIFLNGQFSRFGFGRFSADFGRFTDGFGRFSAGFALARLCRFGAILNSKKHRNIFFKYKMSQQVLVGKLFVNMAKPRAKLKTILEF